MNHTALKQADIHNFDCLYDYNNPGFYLLGGGGGGGGGGKLPAQTLQLPPPQIQKNNLCCFVQCLCLKILWKMPSDSISEHLIFLIFLGGHATRPRQGPPHFLSLLRHCFIQFPPKIKLLDRTLTTQSQWAERRQIVLLMSCVPEGTTKSSVRPVHHFHSC